MFISLLLVSYVVLKAPVAASNETMELPATSLTAPPVQPDILYVCGANYTDADMYTCVNPGCRSSTGDGCAEGLTCFAVPFVNCEEVGASTTVAATVAGDGSTTAAIMGGTTVSSTNETVTTVSSGNETFTTVSSGSGTTTAVASPTNASIVEVNTTASPAVGWSPTFALVGNEAEVESILKRVETSVLAFRDHIESLYTSRCDPASLAECDKGNYDDCSSTYPNQQCMDASELVVPLCGDGKTCNALWDKTQTAVRIPASLTGPTGNPTDPEVIESICYSRLAEPYMINTFNEGHQMYFGSSTGAFRIIPARHSETCGNYDPRYRPWFVAASSGPKDVVLVIDISGSMKGRRMDLAKEAASTIVETLSVADRFAVITFSDFASQIGEEEGLIVATDENKKQMIELIQNLEARGGTNFYDGFDKAFDTIEQTIKDELTSGCNIAMLFMTDGRISAGPGEDKVISLVNQRVESLATNFNQTTTIFTYSLGQDADDYVTKRLACETNGIWTPVDDFADDLITAMSSYYKLYASGLGQGGNEDWVAWVEPYQFYTGGKNGTSVSAPVYDRSVTPPLFLGVATIDMLMDEYEEALGADASSSTVLERFVLLSTARCPKIELSQCELEGLRFIGGRENSLCGVCNNTEYDSNVTNVCPNQRDLPWDVWINTEMRGKNFTERVCCKVGDTVPSDTCPVTILSTEESPGISTNIVLGLAIGIPLGFIIILLLLVRINRGSCHRTRSDASGDKESVRIEPIMHRMSSSVNESVSVIAIPVSLSPSAPPINPAFRTN
eukprot:CCRYP_014456-RA/>CCRYP_014456-RA protein AED:0.03 eAED:0.03 QI:213/1/1/1/1/1/3/251/787